MFTVVDCTLHALQSLKVICLQMQFTFKAAKCNIRVTLPSSIFGCTQLGRTCTLLAMRLVHCMYIMYLGTSYCTILSLTVLHSLGTVLSAQLPAVVSLYKRHS